MITPVNTHRRVRSRGWIKSAAVLTVAGVLAAACGSDAPPAADVADAATTVPASDPVDDSGTVNSAGESDANDADGNDLPAGEYKFGYAGIESGAAAFAGIPTGHGVELAVQQINDSGFLGDGATLVYDAEDTAGDPAKSINFVNRFIEDDDVLGIVCCLLSGESGALVPLIQAAGLPAVTTVVLLEGLNNPPYQYRTQLLPGQPGGAHEQLVSEMIGVSQPKTAAIAVTADSQGQMAELPSWIEPLEANGVEVVLEVQTLSADVDFTGPATQIAHEDPDLFINSMYGGTGALMIKAQRDRGYTGEIVSNYGISAQDSYDNAGEALDGAVFPVSFYLDSPLPAAQEFAADYEEKFGESPDSFSVNGYLAAWFFAHRLRLAPDITREGLATGLSQVDAMTETPIGDITFVDGQAELGEFLFVMWDDGNQELWKS